MIIHKNYCSFCKTCLIKRYLCGKISNMIDELFGVNEIDFVAEKNGQKVYIQVCYMLVYEDTINREFGNLLKISDNYPKYVVTMDEYNTGDYSGIQQIHLKDFLMKQVL